MTGVVHPSFWTRGSAGDPESILMWFNFKVDPGLRQDDRTCPCVILDARQRG
jgi:hypothetical protein